ncbi:Clavaminate synthase-like protein [Pleomassaria siparia CBS 279.74]|uniref:Clavaminate synthase-like protein n=1 Tax=Pleomassaria siparia CBS 279.74 TaxID=1314801 RepID=A0A6G1K328_9PLEO|nr:Clavaminate synthase-like protein [Pleomassaria siparia CBS 279.74]
MLLQNHFKSTPAISKWFVTSQGTHELNAEYLEPHGLTLVPLELTQDSRFECLEAPLSLLIAQMTSSQDSSTRLYLAQCHLSALPAALQADLPTPSLISKIGKGDIYGSSLWMGRPPTRTPLHRDPNPNIFVQLAGTKTIRLMGPDAGKRLYESTRSGSGRANLRGEEMMVGKEMNAMEEAIWGEGCVNGEPVTGWEAVLESGDALYIPLGWWHSVRGDKISGSGVNASVNWWFSHVFCTRCADTTGLSRTSNSNRQCPACETQLMNPNDVVVQGLNPSEDYKTSVLSGLSPTVITEVASRGLAFYSYQASQEIIYQEHLAKSLTDKFGDLNQNMDQLIHDANSQIQLVAMQTELTGLEEKNIELANALKEKSRAHQQTQKQYQALKAHGMLSHVAHAASDQASFAINTVRGDRFVDRIPGARTGTVNFGHVGAFQQHGGRKRQERGGSGSSGSVGQGGGIGLGPVWNSHHAQGQQGRVYTGTQGQRIRLPVLGGTRQNAFDSGPAYQPTPMARHALGGGGSRNLGALGGFGIGPKGTTRPGGPVNGPLGQ